MDKTKSWFSEKMNKIKKLARLVKKKRRGGGRRKQITNIRKNRCESLHILHIFLKMSTMKNFMPISATT